MKQLILIISAICLLMPLLVFGSSHQKKLVPSYAYRLIPPYIIDIELEIGLYYDFSRYLSQKSDTYQFHTLFVPRKRIEIYLNRNQMEGMLIGVNPIWFNDAAQKKYLWSSPIFQDQDDLISLANNKLEFNGPQSLYGKKLGGVLGFYYFGIDEAVKSGQITRDNTNSESSILSMILHQRIDAGIVSKSTFDYLVNENSWQGQFHISKQPHDKYSRHILVPHKYEELHKHIEAIARDISSDPIWQEMLRQHHH